MTEQMKAWGIAISYEWQTVRQITESTFPGDAEHRSSGEFVRRQISRLVAAGLVVSDKSRRYRLLVRPVSSVNWEQE
jgi:hypothetical protein